MANTTNTKTEVGIIGQKYQNRKTKKVGTLESRNEKCKTLCMIGDDGKTFNIVYSTFKSDWRKATDGVEVSKPEVKDKAPAENTKVVKMPTKTEKAEKTEKPKKEKVSTEEKVKHLLETKATLEDAITKAKLPLTIKQLSKGGLAIKFGKSSMIEIWPHLDRNIYAFVCYKKMSFSDKSTTSEYKDGWKMPYVYEVKNLSTTLKEMIAAMKDDVLAKAEQKNKKEEK